MNIIKKTMADFAKFLDRTAGVIDDNGRIIACTDEEMLGMDNANTAAVLNADDTVMKIEDKSYKSLRVNGYCPYVVFVEGTDTVSVNYLQLISCCLDSTLREINDSQIVETFLKNVLLENELPGDIPLKAREYDLAYAKRRLVLVVKNQSVDRMTLTTALHKKFSACKSDYVLTLDENTIALLLDASKSEDISSYEETAREILYQFVEMEISIRIGIGLITDNLKDIAKSYREASLALTVGNIFEPTSGVMRYDRLGLGRLIYQLPPSLCQMFLQEVFKPGAYEALDRETLTTIHKFFDYNLNGSETSRQLFVHRNTLVYRLDKVQKITGLDLRNFDDAVLFKLASMVRRYLVRKDSLKHNEPDHWW